MRRLLLVAVLVVNAADGVPDVRITVRPLVSMYGHDVRIECAVAPDPMNRWVALGVDGFSRSIVQLDPNEQQRVSRTVKEPPCGEQTAFCILVRTGNWERRAQQPLTVVCQ